VYFLTGPDGSSFSAPVEVWRRAVPDLVAMLRRRSSAGMNPRMAAIMAVFQILWVYYGLLIVSRPVIAWNLVAILVNVLSVGAFLHLRSKERVQAA
jgi:uncharacterized protein with PQ loop repeat